MSHRKLIIGVLIAGLMSLLMFRPTMADVGTSTSPTHKVFINVNGVWKVRHVGDLCVPYEHIGMPKTGSYVQVTKENKCEGNGLPYGMKKVVTDVGTGWMWDFALEELSDEEKALMGEDQMPIKEEEEDDLELGSTLPDIDMDGSTLPDIDGSTLPNIELEPDIGLNANGN